MNGLHAAFTGRVGSEPEPKYTPSGKALLTFSVIVDQQYVADEQRAAPDAIWVKVTAWEALAEALTDRLKKGSAVYCAGRLKLDKWTSKDGEARTGLSCSASQVELHAQLGRQASRALQAVG